MSKAEYFDSIVSGNHIKVSKTVDVSKLPIPQLKHILALPVYDGVQIIFHGLEQFSMSGAKNGRIVTPTQYANVLEFRDCSAIAIRDLYLGHTKSKGSCMGGVIRLKNCKDVLIENCRLDGSGIYGLELIGCDRVEMRNCEVFNCSQGLVEIRDSASVLIKSNVFHSNTCYDGVGIRYSQVKIVDCTFRNNVGLGDTNRIGHPAMIDGFMHRAELHSSRFIGNKGFETFGILDMDDETTFLNNSWEEDIIFKLFTGKLSEAEFKALKKR